MPSEAGFEVERDLENAESQPIERLLLMQFSQIGEQSHTIGATPRSYRCGSNGST
jgi:hypothetical protein